MYIGMSLLEKYPQGIRLFLRLILQPVVYVVYIERIVVPSKLEASTILFFLCQQSIDIFFILE